MLVESRSKQVQTENMKKVIVNSQVTAFTTICESIGHSVIFLLAFVTKSSEISSETRSQISQIVFIMLHFNILPYVFLVNTRENKSCVVQQGWVSLVRNLICCENISLPCARSNNVVPFQHAEYNVKNEICIISQNLQPNPSTQCSSEQPNIPTSQCNPTSSKGTSRTIYSHRQISVSSTTNSTVSSDIQAQFIENTREIILSELLSNIQDEKTYIGHFIRLSELESGYYNEDETNGLERGNQEVVLNIRKILLSRGSHQSRVVMRQEILQNLQIHQCNNNKYKELLEKYLTMEENFLNDE